MDYEIIGEYLPSVAIFLDRGESIFTQSGAMSWMTNGMKMETTAKGGVLSSLLRTVTGESMFLATYTAQNDGETINISSAFPGHILDVKLGGGHSIIAQKTAFLCAEPNVKLSPHVVKGVGSGFFGGEGFILQEISGNGMVFLEIDGDVINLDLRHGEKIKVSTGHVAAFESSVTYDVQMVGGVKNTFFGGEGVFHTTLTGPGQVWIQSIPLTKFAQSLSPLISPTKRSSKD